MREYLLVSPPQALGFFVALLVLVAAVFGLGYWAGVWKWFGRDEPELPPKVDTLESATTVDLTTGAAPKPRRHPRPERTGTIHAAHLTPDESPTEVIRRPGVRS